jgi:hypothetical protein
MQKINFYLFIFTLFFLLFSCKDEKKIPNVDIIDIKLDIVRFDQAMFALDTANIDAGLQKLSRLYPAFYHLYFNNILPLTNDSSKLGLSVKNFINDQQIHKLYDTTQTVMKNWPEIEKEIKQAFRFVKYYIPTFKPPKIYTFISEYSMQRMIFQDKNADGLGIGLDLFLGNQYPYKSVDPTNPNFSAYLTRTFNSQHIVPKSIDLIIDNLFDNIEGTKLIDIMIANGKKLYLKKLFLPLTNDTLIFEYTPPQLEWVKKNELEIWSFFADQNLVYESIPVKIAKYINASPNAPGMPAEAPGRTANYIGLKIVEAYLQKYPKTSLEHFIEMKDAQKILELSKYKPKRKS